MNVIRRFLSSQVEQQAKAVILDGSSHSKLWQSELAEEATKLKKRLQRPPGLAFVVVGERPDSQIYIQRKQEACQQVGITSSLKRLRANTSQAELEAVVRHLCKQSTVDGLLVQLPLPAHLDEEAVIDSFDPSKDVDGFHPINVGRLIMRNRQRLLPCTALGCMELLTRSGINLKGKEAVIVGDSNVVGTPLAMLLRSSGISAFTLCSRPSMQALLLDRQRTDEQVAPDVCLPRLPGPVSSGGGQQKPADSFQATRADFPVAPIGTSGGNDGAHQGNTNAARSVDSIDLPSITRRADILVVAVGKPELVKADWVKPGAVVLDVGINVVEGSNGHSKVVGDVAFEEVSKVAAAVTPVPGGVGPMTIAAVLHNTLQAAWLHAGERHQPSCQYAGQRFTDA